MRKLFLLTLVFALLAGMMPVAAQEEVTEYVPCTEEEISTTTEALSAIMDSFAEIGAMFVDGDATSVSAVVVGYEALSTGYWAEIYPEVPQCLEAVDLAYNIGLILDESLIAAGLTRLSLYEAEHGDADVAEEIAGYASARAESLQEDSEAYFTMISEEGIQPAEALPACTEDDLASEAVTALTDSMTAYQELGDLSVEASMEDMSLLLVGYAELSSTYWDEIYPELPACAEAFELGYNIGIVYDDSLIIVTLAQLAAYEAEYGQVEVAQLYADAAAARAEILTSDVEEYFGEAEAEA